MGCKGISYLQPAQGNHTDTPPAGIGRLKYFRKQLANTLDVMDNDAPSIGGTLNLISVTTPDQGGSATIDRNGTFSDPSDDVILKVEECHQYPY